MRLVDCGDGVWLGDAKACDAHAAEFDRVVHGWSDVNRAEGRACKATAAESAGRGLAVRLSELQPTRSWSITPDAIADYTAGPGRVLCHCAGGSSRGPCLAFVAKVARGVGPWKARNEIERAMYRDPTCGYLPDAGAVVWTDLFRWAEARGAVKVVNASTSEGRAAEGVAPLSGNDELRERAAMIEWFHDFEILPGVMTGGVQKVLEMLPRLWLPARLDGMRCADLGTNDGFFAAEMARRGAAEVRAYDHPDWGVAGYGFRKKQGFDLLMEALDPAFRGVISEHEVEFNEPATFDADIPREYFDLVLCSGVLYHLLDPFGFLRSAYETLRPGGKLIVETHVALLGVPTPAAEFYPGAEFNGDRTNFWGPNPACVIGWLTAAGFSMPSQVGSTVGIGTMSPRAIFHATRPA